MSSFLPVGNMRWTNRPPANYWPWVCYGPFGDRLGERAAIRRISVDIEETCGPNLCKEWESEGEKWLMVPTEASVLKAFSKLVEALVEQGDFVVQDDLFDEAQIQADLDWAAMDAEERMKLLEDFGEIILEQVIEEHPPPDVLDVMIDTIMLKDSNLFAPPLETCPG